ncbi:MAG TPA: ROK family protein [Candidatus Nanopelagicales bacterium]|nr:ROK family protein [Candidatus Nanopelagicales bacterium]
MTVVLALDVGGTKLAAGLVDDEGTVLVHDRVPTPVSLDPEELWGALAGLVDGLLERPGATAYAAIGVGCGGPMEWPAGRVSPINIHGWRGFPLLDRVRERYADGRPAVIHNDAVALALAEHRWGAGRGYDHVLGMVVSTGVGGGLVVGGRRVDGGTGNAGHVGHIVVDPLGPACPCGGRGCVEAIARGPALAEYAVSRGWQGEQTGLAVAEGGRAGDPACLAAFERAGRAVGLGIVSACAVLDLDVVTIGGGVAQSGDLFFAPVLRTFDEYAGLAFIRRVRILPAQLGPLAGLSGAAALVLDAL